MKARLAVAAFALAGALAVSATAANATTAVFDFGVGPNGVTTASWQNDEGQSHTFTASGLSLTASAFGPNYWNNGWQADHLFGKHGGGSENGLGMTNDPTGQTEIYNGMGFIQLDVSTLTGDQLTLLFGSTTQGEQWSVYGTNLAGTLASATLPGTLGTTRTLIGQGTTETTLTFTDAFKYYDIVSTSSSGGKNVLLTSLTVRTVPEPATWGLMILGMGAVGAALRGRRKGVFGGALA